MSKSVINNYSKLRLSLFLVPLFLLAAIVLYLYSHHALHIDNYVEIQKNCFFFLNSKLSRFPNTIYNLTQLGDALIFLSFLTIFVIYAPKIWECLLSALLVSIIFSCIPKRIFAVPRPAAVLDHDRFIIIGKTLSGHNSLPSGHSVTIFTILTVLCFAFVPKNRNYKVLYFSLTAIIGLLLVLTRVGIGAHYPLDVLIGAILGYISGLSGIFISRKYKIWSWVNKTKYYPVFILLFLICGNFIFRKIAHENLIIYYFSLASIVVSLYKITHLYVKKRYKNNSFRLDNEPS